MDYNRQEFINGKTILKAEMLDHIEDGILNSEKDNFIFNYGRSVNNEIYKKEALRPSEGDIIDFIAGADQNNFLGIMKISNKVPTVTQLLNGFTLGAEVMVGINDDNEDKIDEALEYISDYYTKIFGNMAGEFCASGYTIPRIPFTFCARKFMASEALNAMILQDPDSSKVWGISLPLEEPNIFSSLFIFVEEDFLEEDVYIEKGTYIIPTFSFLMLPSLYISGFSFEEEKKEEELPIIESYGNTITWDGNTNGLTWFSEEDGAAFIKWYKVSNNVPSYEELLNGYKIRLKSESYTPETTQGPVIKEEEFEIDSSKVLSDLKVHSNFYILADGMIIIVFKQAEGEDSIDFSPGTYLIKVDEEEPPYYGRAIISSFTTYGFNNWVPIVTNEKKEQGIFLYFSDKLLEGDLYLYKTPSAVEGARVSYNELKTWVNEKKHILISNPYSTYFSSVNIYDFSNENFGRIITQLNMEGSSIELVPVPLFTAEYVGGEN